MQEQNVTAKENDDCVVTRTELTWVNGKYNGAQKKKAAVSLGFTMIQQDITVKEGHDGVTKMRNIKLYNSGASSVKQGNLEYVVDTEGQAISVFFLFCRGGGSQLFGSG